MGGAFEECATTEMLYAPLNILSCPYLLHPTYHLSFTPHNSRTRSIWFSPPPHLISSIYPSILGITSILFHIEVSGPLLPNSFVPFMTHILAFISLGFVVYVK